MDREALTQVLALIASVLASLKQAKDLLPDSPKKTEAEQALRQAERQLKIAEAETAEALGYWLCRNHFPPAIMLSKDDWTWECPQCGNKKENWIMA